MALAAGAAPDTGTRAPATRRQIVNDALGKMQAGASRDDAMDEAFIKLFGHATETRTAYSSSRRAQLCSRALSVR
jgi:hypothetical protein